MTNASVSNHSPSTLLAEIDKTRLPKHIAIIMDGNGRWATQRHLPRIEGHRAGIKSVREVVEAGCELGIGVITLYTFSIENWKRPTTEIRFLMRLMEQFLYDEIEEMNQNGVRLLITGRTERVPDFVLKAMEIAQNKTQHNSKLILNLAFNYSGRAEIIDAIKKLVIDIQNQKIHPAEVNEQVFGKYLYAPELPDPDLCIRTSGELRISNFLLWEMAYTELWYTEVLWPDFRREHLYQAILDFQRRERRFGQVSQSSDL
ncbi:MAG: isoprenyl transferase [bacterium]|nr:isoprenyl transferase [bacterium]